MTAVAADAPADQIPIVKMKAVDAKALAARRARAARRSIINFLFIS
jgi:hypothetical protein